MQLPEYSQALLRGREVRSRLNQLYPKEAALDREHYGRALRLPNATHPDVVSAHTCTPCGCGVGLTPCPSVLCCSLLVMRAKPEWSNWWDRNQVGERLSSL